MSSRNLQKMGMRQELVQKPTLRLQCEDASACHDCYDKPVIQAPNCPGGNSPLTTTKHFRTVEEALSSA